MVGIAQLVRVSDCGSEGHRFNSDYPPKTKDLLGYGYPSILSQWRTEFEFRIGRQNVLNKLGLNLKNYHILLYGNNSGVAQRQSIGLLNRGSGYRNSPPEQNLR